MFTDTISVPEANIEFDEDSFKESVLDYNDFVNLVIKNNNLDSSNIVRSWDRDYSNNNSPLDRDYLHRYDIPIYYISQLRDSILSGVHEPRILEIGSYATGLFPAMYLSTKGFKSEVMDVYSIELAFKNLSRIAKSYGVTIHHSNWIHPHDHIYENKFNIIYIQSLPWYFFDDYDENRLGEITSNLLNDDGIFICSRNDHTDLHAQFPLHFKRLSKCDGREFNSSMYGESSIDIYQKK